jgi:hypothetical protein
MTSAVSFGLSVGLREGGTFIALIEAGHVPAVQIVNPATGRLQHYLRPEEIAAFHRRFATIRTLSAETGHHRNTLRGQLAGSGVAHFAPEGQDFGPVYLREEVVAALQPTGILDARATERKMPLDAA